MSSFKLVLPSVRTPLHASFSSTNDTIAFLWENGQVQVWNLQTRLGPGSGKITNPLKVGEGIVPISLARRVNVSAVTDGKVTLAILGSRENDALMYAEAGNGIFEPKNEIDLPGLGGTIPDAAIDIWQDSKGRVFRGLAASMWIGCSLTRFISRRLGICERGRQVPRILFCLP